MPLRALASLGITGPASEAGRVRPGTAADADPSATLDPWRAGDAAVERFFLDAGRMQYLRAVSAPDGGESAEGVS
jgi:hypothetical protein